MSALDDFSAAEGSGDGAPPFEDYEELTVAKVLPHLETLNRSQLWRVYEYERRHANRLAIIKAIERAIG